MGSPTSNRILLVIIILAIFGAGLLGFFVWRNNNAPKAVPTVVATPLGPQYRVIGTSVQGRKIESYTYGHGATHLAFVGGMHGGYEWNSVLLAYTFMDYLAANPNAVPQDLTVTVIPDANPDGVYKVTGKEGRFTADDIPAGVSTVPGRFNANDVDLNRNFACRWKPESTWQNQTVSSGSAAWSEPEARAIRDFVLAAKPAAVVFWHSQSGTVYASQCQAGILPTTLDIMTAYAQAAGYKTDKSFDSYAISGDAEGWLASIGIPAITVELTTHDTVEWSKNLAGIKAIFNYYGQVKKI